MGGGVEGTNAVTATINGFVDSQGKQNSETKEAFANNNFYANIGVNAGFTKAKSKIIPVSSVDLNAKIIKEFEGFGQSFSVNIGFSGLSAGLDVGLDSGLGGVFNIQPKQLKWFNNPKKIGATITYNPGYTWLISDREFKNYFSKIPNGLKIYNFLMRGVNKLRWK